MSPRCVQACAVVLTWFSVAAARAQHESPAGYYDGAQNLTGVALKAALAARIKGHAVLPYTSTATDTWDALMFLDEDPADPASVVLTYSGLTNLKTNNYTGGVGDLAYLRHRGASGVVISYESSPDLAAWGAAEFVSVDVESLPAQLESVVVRVAAPGRSLFLRIRMQRPVP